MNLQDSGSTTSKKATREKLPDEASGYWYGHSAEMASSIALLNLLRQYREAERQMRVRTRDLMQMGEKDLAALRFLIRENESGRMPRQTDLAFALKITSASTSVLVDRLARDGHLLRVPHPEDRRSVVLEIPADTHQKVKATLGGMHSRMLEVAEALTEQERSGAAKFLEGLLSTVSHSGLDRD